MQFLEYIFFEPVAPSLCLYLDVRIMTLLFKIRDLMVKIVLFLLCIFIFSILEMWIYPWPVLNFFRELQLCLHSVPSPSSWLNCESTWRWRHMSRTCLIFIFKAGKYRFPFRKCRGLQGLCQSLTLFSECTFLTTWLLAAR